MKAPPFNAENAAEYGRRGQKALKEARKRKAEEQASLALRTFQEPFTVPEHAVRLCGLLAALDKKLAVEIARGEPNGALIRDLSSARRTLLSQADGVKEPSKPLELNDAPTLADPEPAQE